MRRNNGELIKRKTEDVLVVVNFPMRSLLICAGVLASFPVLAQSPADCAQEGNDAQRLACYDRLFRRDEAATPLPTAGAVPSVPAPENVEGKVASKAEFNALSKFWELTPDDKRGTFVVRTYLPTYFLPLHHTNSINTAPYSPTQPAPSQPNHYRQTEAKLQISLRTKVAEDWLLPNADLWFAYTQRSLWQLWNQADSSPFRNTDYQPEIIFVAPISAPLGELADGWRWRLMQAGWAHQSNGQSDPLSRSWNRAYVGTAFDHGDFTVHLRLSRRLGDKGQDDNPDLMHYLGHGEIGASWLGERATTSLLWRTDLGPLRRSSLQLDWTYPVYASQPSGLRWYLQLFSGYGETLLDYNHRQTSFGAGLSLFQF